MKDSTTRVYVCVCVCGWMSGLFPWLHLQPPSRETHSQCGSRKKPHQNDAFIMTLPTKCEQKEAGFNATGILFPLFCNIPTAEIILQCASSLSGHLRPSSLTLIIAYVTIFISSCSSPHRA